MRHTGHIRERSPGSFELRYSLGTDPAKGKRRIATATVRGTKKEAERELRRLLRTVDTGEHVDPTRITVRQWLNTWLDAARAEVSSRRHIHRILSAALGRAVEQQLVARNPADVFKKRLPKVERREVTALTAEQSQQMLIIS